MPELSRFYGIVITMHYNDHPPPHFHAWYGEDAVTVEIETGVITGRMARRALALVLEWSDAYRDELMDNWDRARARRPLEPIPPLR